MLELVEQVLWWRAPPAFSQERFSWWLHGTGAADLDTRKAFSFSPPDLNVSVTAPPLCASPCAWTDSGSTLNCDSIVFIAAVVLWGLLWKKWGLHGLLILFIHTHAPKYISVAGLFLVANVDHMLALTLWHLRAPNLWPKRRIKAKTKKKIIFSIVS